MHIRKNQSAIASKQTAGLSKARTGKGGTSKADQFTADLLGYVGKYPGVTVKVAAWRLSGLATDAAGNPDPDLVKKIGDYEFYKKRASDAAAMPPSSDDSDDVRAEKLRRMNGRPMVYGPALFNPFTESGGHGLYLSSEKKRPVPQEIPTAGTPFKTIESVPEVERVTKSLADVRADLESFDE